MGFITAVLVLMFGMQNQVFAFLSPAYIQGCKAGGVFVLYALLVFGVVRGRRVEVTDVATGTEGEFLVAYASQSGTAEELARRTAKALSAGGRIAHLVNFSNLDLTRLTGSETALFVVSTTGEGGAPDTAVHFETHITNGAPHLARLKYGVLALGDRNYPEFCAFGRALDNWLKAGEAQPLFDRVDVDQANEVAISLWFEHVASLGAVKVGLPSDKFQSWYLDNRVLLNPGSENPAVYHVGLMPTGKTPDWRAGDIAVVRPRNAPSLVQSCLAATRFSGNERVSYRNLDLSLAAALSNLALGHLPLTHASPQALIDSLPPLPLREYSLASLPSDRRLELVVRQMRGVGGQLGMGSGWLTEFAPVGEAVEIRLRANASFHGPDDDRPMILVGAGSGIAGLRAHLKEREQKGHNRNWLIFGERNKRVDYLFEQELEAWRTRDVLKRLDLCFMENGVQRMVQEVFYDKQTEVAEWLEAGAAIYVSGSRARIGVGVDKALKDLVGERHMQAMVERGLYKKDVY
ncbi:flavodoxin domain-containing protein [Kordiimonas sp.]|uniref:flavodoxin domain-containing protein n=1 Tax=Kordiimonas sp. TaxID=1970157 RepID=UPI003A8DE300